VATKERTKEELAWLRVLCPLVVAIDVALIGWAAQSYVTAPALLLGLAYAIVAILTVALGWIARASRRRINQLKD
jgi:ABC-type transport system involved in cytochrome bd biosynthesis fused ATPase/permease subunit